jgi:hypothetical protein
MKLAIIDRLDRPDFWTHDTLEATTAALTKKGFEVSRARTFDDFERIHGSLDGFNGLLYHPDFLEIPVLKEIPHSYPDLHLAIGSHDIKSSSDRDGEIPAFDFKDVEGIHTYFSKQKR